MKDLREFQREFPGDHFYTPNKDNNFKPKITQLEMNMIFTEVPAPHSLLE